MVGVKIETQTKSEFVKVTLEVKGCSWGHQIQSWLWRIWFAETALEITHLDLFGEKISSVNWIITNNMFRLEKRYTKSCVEKRKMN